MSPSSKTTTAGDDTVSSVQSPSTLPSSACTPASSPPASVASSVQPPRAPPRNPHHSTKAGKPPARALPRSIQSTQPPPKSTSSTPGSHNVTSPSQYPRKVRPLRPHPCTATNKRRGNMGLDIPLHQQIPLPPHPGHRPLPHVPPRIRRLSRGPNRP